MKLVLEIFFVYFSVVALWDLGMFVGHYRLALVLLVVSGLISLGYLARKAGL